MILGMALYSGFAAAPDAGAVTAGFALACVEVALLRPGAA